MKSKTEIKQFVTKDMLIGDIISKYPETAHVMLSYGLHCIGCSANPFDTIKTGCMIHGMDEETINNLVKDVNMEIERKYSKTKKTISVTENAASKFKKFMEDENKNNAGIRFSVTIKEHEDMQYSLDFTNAAEKTEEVIEDKGIKIFVEKDIVNMIKGTEIDFVENEKGSGFRINNPNVGSSGGCGPSCGCAE